MQKMRREVLRKIKTLVIESWNKNSLDKSKKFLIPYVDALIEIVIDILREESNNPPVPCCGHHLEQEEIKIYKAVKTKRRL